MSTDGKIGEIAPPPIVGGDTRSSGATTLPGEGERRSQRGYERQYQSAAAAIYAALDRGDLAWVGLADRTAGIADDVVLGFPGRVIGHQFKTSQFPGKFTLRTLLLGAAGLLKPLTDAWQSLMSTNPGNTIEIRLVTNDYPSNRDSVGTGPSDHSAAFLAEFGQHSGRTLAEWRQTRWQSFIDELCQASGLDEPAFEQFLKTFCLLQGPAADFVQLHRLSTEGVRLAKEIAALLPRLVADPRDKNRWTRAELLHELGWRDSTITRHHHLFPVGAHVQRNAESEEALRRAIRGATQGYISLVGPPGAGKSTLLQISLATETGVLVSRYLAYVPGVGQGLGRGEADDFLEDVATQLKNSGLAGERFRNETLHERREQFGVLLQQAGERYQRDHVRTLIVVDGLDHVPREERPQISFLAELPLPESIPAGVLFVLGTQSLELQDLRPAVRDQGAKADRKILVSPLKCEAVYRMAALSELDAEISRPRLFELSQGHPLVTRYLIEALRDADSTRREEILSGAMAFEGDVEAVYESAWRGIRDDVDARNVLGFLARAEGPMPLELLAHEIPEQAIERALKSTRHLLAESSLGWSTFHNSFRLFILAKSQLRFGRVDLGYSARVYRALAKVSRSASTDTPQRWLELRYLARAGDNSEVLSIAQAPRFRSQLAEGRPFSELDADIRLALTAVKGTHDATAIIRLLLARDEISRRSTTLEQASDVTEALLAVGDINAAQALAEEYGNQGYEVVDALLAADEYTRAMGLFDKLEPIQLLLTGRLETRSAQENARKFAEWAQRVWQFRDFEQINQAIDRLSTAGLGHLVGDREDAASQLASNLRYEVALAIVASRSNADPADICRKLNLESAVIPELLTRSGIQARARGANSLAMQLFRQAVNQEGFQEVVNSWRRTVALSAVYAGDVEMARAIFDGLTVPSMSSLDDELDSGAPRHMARAVMEHAQLATLVGRSIAMVDPSKRPILRPLQQHANTVGILRGNAHAASGGIPNGEVARAIRVFLSYLARVTPRAGGDFYAMRQIAVAAPVLGRTLVQTAALCGEEEFRLVLAELDRAFDGSNSDKGIVTNMRREVAVAIYRANGDTDAASRRLEPLVSTLWENTPTEQVDGLATLATTFARVGDHARARELLAQIPANTLGYALAPKKDPQYAMWRELLMRANAADPSRRGDRVSLLMRQVAGMVETEGHSAAYRIASALITEAAMDSAETGLATARDLSGKGLIGWPNLVNALLLGAIKRRPDVVLACGVTWCELALPYYREPYFRESHLGEFIEVAVNLASETEVEALIEMLCSAIEAQSRTHERSSLLQELHAAAKKRGRNFGPLDDALLRWSAESPAPRHSDTPQKYDSTTSLIELNAAFEQNSSSTGLDYEAARAFNRLAPAAGFEAAREMFDRWSFLQSESRSRFLLVDLAVAAGRDDYARSLIADYEASPDERATWTAWTGGGSLRYFRASSKLRGASVHHKAFEDFVSSVALGREMLISVMSEIDEILPVITQAPDWPAIWDLLAEQLQTTREHGRATTFAVVGGHITEEEAIAALFRWALAIPVSEVQRSAHVGAQRIKDVQGGHEILAHLVRSLLSGDGNEPAHALQLLLRDTGESQLTELCDMVAGLVDNPDYAVAEAAAVLSRRWGGLVSMTASSLPSFYELVLQEQDDDFESSTLSDIESGAMLVEDPLGWTAMFPQLVTSLARQQITPAHIRHRSRMFIEQWGGLAMFGKTATAELQAELARLDMRIPHWRPHVMVAARALRYVAGELRRGGLLGPDEAPFLLHLMNFPAPTLPLVLPIARPSFIPRPKFDADIWNDAERAEKWINDLENDLQPLAALPDEKVIAEISTFEIRNFRRAAYTLARIRAPFLEVGDRDEFDDWIDVLPRAMWAGGFRAVTKEPSLSIVRRLYVHYMPDVPPFQIIICPCWLRKLGWRVHPDNWLVYVDSSQRVVARVIWWRDGGPVDVEDDVIWGEGVYVTVTRDGVGQLEAICGRLSVTTHVRRKVRPESSDADPLARSASSRY